MFITDDAGKIPIPAALFGGEDSSYWNYVKLHLHLPWFYCVYKNGKGDGGEFRHMVLLSHPAQLEQWSQMDGIEIVEAQVVLPAHMTDQGRWTMEPLASIWEGEVSGAGHTEHVYVTLGGRRFTTNASITGENQLAAKRLLYRSPAKRTS